MTEHQEPEHSQEQNGCGELESDQELINILTREDPYAAPNLRVITGFLLGESPREGYRRLYLTLELNKYIEFPSRNLVYSKSLRTELNPLAGTIVWVDRDTKLQQIHIAEDESLEGKSHLPPALFAPTATFRCCTNCPSGSGCICDD